MKLKILATGLLALVPAMTLAQIPPPNNEGGAATQTLVLAISKQGISPTIQTTTVEVDGHKVPLAGLAKVQPGNTQIALLIDDGLSRSAGVQLQDLRAFANSLPPTTELFVGYMANGRVLPVANFTTDHVKAAKAIRLPLSLAGLSGSPYFCLSDFVKHWPTGEDHVDLTRQQPAGAPLKARFVVMVTNGVDPYNGSVSVLNQNSPYVQSAARDAQRAGVPVYSIYYSDSAFGSGAASFSGQNYLYQVAEATGGRSLYQGTMNPVSLLPFLREFADNVSDTYIATFPAGAESAARDRLVQLKISTSEKDLKLRHATSVMPGTLESTVQQ
jgi:hypothetical protein